MDAATKKRYDDFVRYLRKESRLPLANRFLSEETAEVVAQSWFNKSWSEMMHEDLAEEGDRFHYHRTLNKACKHDVPRLALLMEKNVYAATILDLIFQEKSELEELEAPDPLYLLEMAMGLAEVEHLQPTHLHMLKLIAFHQDKYGSLDQLRGEESPRHVARRLVAAEAREKKRPKLEALPDFETLEPNERAVQFVNQAVVDMWSRFEKSVSEKVTRLLHDSRSMKRVKTELWQRQENAEDILLKTEALCDDEILYNQFQTDLESKLPAFRREMGKKIAASPVLAEKIYDILDALVENEVSAFEYLDIALDLSKCNHEAVIEVIRLNLQAKGRKFTSYVAIRELLDMAISE